MIFKEDRLISFADVAEMFSVNIVRVYQAVKKAGIEPRFVARVQYLRSSQLPLVEKALKTPPPVKKVDGYLSPNEIYKRYPVLTPRYFRSMRQHLDKTKSGNTILYSIASVETYIRDKNLVARTPKGFVQRSTLTDRIYQPIGKFDAYIEAGELDTATVVSKTGRYAVVYNKQQIDEIANRLYIENRYEKLTSNYKPKKRAVKAVKLERPKKKSAWRERL